MEASALTHASRRGLLARKSPLLKLQGDEKLIAMARGGNPGAFETIVDRYQGRLLGFCRQMLGSTEDAEDVLQEVFVNAYRAMLADEREINLRPWLYRIARNRCLNHLRKPSADAQESMDMVPEVEAASTAEKVHNREEFRQILSDVNKLPETQRSALLLREMDALSYEEIADAMETTVPSVKSLLVRARISLAEASQARLLTCGEVRVELSEAAEGLRKASAPVRRHVRECDDCADFRSQVRSNEKLLAALFPVPALLAFKAFIASKLGLGGGSAASGAAGSAAAGGAAAGGGAAAAGGAASGIGAALGGSGAASGLGGLGGAIGGAIGTKAVAGVVTAAVITAGAAVELPKEHHSTPIVPAAKEAPAPVPVVSAPETGGVEANIATTSAPESGKPAIASNAVAVAPTKAEEAEEAQFALAAPEEVPAAPVETEAAPPGEATPVANPQAGASDTETSAVTGGIEVESATPASPTTTAGAHGGKSTVTVTVAPEAPPAKTPPATTPPPAPTGPVASSPPSSPAPASTPTSIEPEAPAASVASPVEAPAGAEEAP
ncbi:MAG: sigma-70 family RNA polymerase sigma factor [Actinobacteria bacterium]|nr:sigma-70 family RNA polymerase sigma factor [Actinomycetota bacterium]